MPLTPARHLSPEGGVPPFNTQLSEEAKDPKTIAEQAQPLADHGTNQHREDEGLDIIKSKIIGETSSSYLTAAE